MALRGPWLALGAIGCIDALWLAFTPLRLGPNAPSFVFGLGASVLLCLLLAKEAGRWPRLRCLLSGFAFLLASWPVLRLFNHLVMTTGLPLADSTLSFWDAAVGFDWHAYLHWLDGQPMTLIAMSWAYCGLTGYSCFLFLLLATGPEPDKRCAELIGLFVITAVACSSIGMFFPAEAAMTYYAPPAGTFRHFDAGTGAYHLRHLGLLRDGGAHVVDLNDLPGLTTFPSFHTAMGVVAIFCARGTPWLFVPMAAINTVMIAATPAFGSHYGIDIVAGAAVAAGAICLYRKLPTYELTRKVERAIPVFVVSPGSAHLAAMHGRLPRLARMEPRWIARLYQRERRG